MYRNTYLQFYKNTASHQQNPTILLNHFSQIYNTLGCVLQDLEYQIGRLQLKNSKLQNKEENEREISHQNYQKSSKLIPNQKNIIKIEDSINEVQLKKTRNSQKQSIQQKNNNRKSQFIQQIIKSEEKEPKMDVNKLIKFNEKLTHQKESQKRSPYLISEKVRGEVKPNRKSDSFDELFDQIKEQKIKIEKNKKPIVSNLPPIQQNYQQSENSQAQNTYDDFMDRIFKDSESRRSR